MGIYCFLSCCLLLALQALSLPLTMQLCLLQILVDALSPDQSPVYTGRARVLGWLLPEFLRNLLTWLQLASGGLLGVNSLPSHSPLGASSLQLLVLVGIGCLELLEACLLSFQLLLLLRRRELNYLLVAETHQHVSLAVTLQACQCAGLVRLQYFVGAVNDVASFLLGGAHCEVAVIGHRRTLQRKRNNVLED